MFKKKISSYREVSIKLSKQKSRNGAKLSAVTTPSYNRKSNIFSFLIFNAESMICKK